MLKLENISKAYGSQTVLDRLDFEIREKELVSVMGKSGSGKTTLLSILAGLVKPDAGRIIFRDREITANSEDEWAEFRLLNIGIVFQDFKIFPSVSAADNVMLAMYPRNDVSPAEKQARVAEALSEVGLEAKAGETADNLSGGEKQRVAIARSLVNRPALVLADEPTGNLDQATGREVLGLVKKLHEEMSTSFLIITHDPDIAHKTQRTYTLAGGRLRQ